MDGVCTVWIIFLKNWETGTTDWQLGSGTPRTSHTAENIDAVNDLALSQEGAPGTHKTTRQIARETGQWDASYTKTFSESVWRNDSSITDQAINQWRDHLNGPVNAEANTLKICRDVFVRNWQIFVMFKACVYCGYEQIGICCVSQGSVMTFIGRDG